MTDISDKIKDAPKESLGFIKFVFNMDEDNKAKLFNMLQYVLIAIIPVVLILKFVKDFIPEADEMKSTIELLAESLGQVLFMFVCLWFVHKLIEYIPTYSGKSYSLFNESSFVLGFLILLFTMQTKLGEKVHILWERVSSLWGGGEDDKKNNFRSSSKKGEGNVVRITQPLSQGLGPSQPFPPPGGMPQNNLALGLPPAMPTVPSGAATSFDSQQPSFNQPSAQNSLQDNMGPMAANEAFGGSMFGGSAF
jgi:hypothetical protein